MEDYNVKDRIITNEDWEKWLKMKEEYSDRHLSNIPETPTKKETKYAVIEWHKYPEDKPKKDNPYLVSIKTGDDSFTSTSHWIAPKEIFRDFWDDHISAWAEMPAPYKEEES